MVKRNIYRAYYMTENEEKVKESIVNSSERINKKIEEKMILSFSAFCWHGNLFVYYETINNHKITHILPAEIIENTIVFLRPIPDTNGKEKFFVEMMDIFHGNEPQSIEHWTRKNKDYKGTARINRLKPEMYSSYIYYHYQYQEEFPGDGEKYGIIAIDQDLMFYYMEDPSTKEKAVHTGKLNSKNTPKEQWHSIMPEHFLPWEDVSHPWRDIENIITIAPL